MLEIGLIGGGGMAQDVARIVASSFAADLSIVARLTRGTAPSDRATPEIGVDVSTLDALLARHPQIIVEVASQQAVRQYGADILGQGLDLLVVSTGALTEPAVLDGMRSAARASGARLMIPAGAIGGMDVVGALKIGGLREVLYRSRKPPRAWKGTPAEQLLDLDAIDSPTVFFSGTAREAAARFPQNANVAATIALAGLGFDRTRVELVADPHRMTNQHEIEAEGIIGRTMFIIESQPSAANPKTSALTAYSVVRALLNEQGTLVV